MKILVTGGLGYLGSRLLAHLDATGLYEITATSRRCNVPEAVQQLRSVRVKKIDYADPVLMADLLKEQQVVINLAAANEILAGKNPVAALMHTAGHTWRLLEAVDTSSLNLFLQFSTIHVYGNPLPGYIDETSPAMPGHAYAIAHHAAEQLVNMAVRQKHFKHLILRLSNAIGPPLFADVNRWTLLVNDLCLQAVQQGKLVLKTHGRQWRNFIAIEEICRFVQQAIHAESTNNNFFTGTINLAGSHNMTVLQMAKLVQSRYELMHCQPLPMEVPADGHGSYHEPLLVSRIKLADWGAAADIPLENEIDALLNFCGMMSI